MQKAFLHRILGILVRQQHGAGHRIRPLLVSAHELREGVATIFREDELILEAQQQAIDERPGYSFYNLNIDAGSMWAL